MSIGSSQSQLNTKPKQIQGGPSKQSSEVVLNAYIQTAKELLNERYKTLITTKQSTDSVGDRYELTIAINELKTIYELLFGKDN